MSKMEARIQVYPHNDLLNTAYYHLKNIRSKVESGTEDALTLDCMTCILLLGFSVEAITNYFVFKCLNYSSRKMKKEYFQTKFEELCKYAKYEIKSTEEPFKTISKLRQIRNSMAHAKPIVRTINGDIDLDAKVHMVTTWDNDCTPEFVENAHKQVKNYQNTLENKLNIHPSETVTQADTYGHF